MTDSLLIVGSIIDRKYRVDRVVAEGGFGTVFAAKHLGLGTPVALKVLRPQPHLSNDDWMDQIQQFREEATALARLGSSQVVRVLDSGIAPRGDDPVGMPWMALEWLDGETLRDELATRRRAGKHGRTNVECMELLRPVLETVADAHELGIAHRDLKPNNIMLVPVKGGVAPRVLDFGIAKFMASGPDAPVPGDTATDSRAPAFTASCAAPEQLAGSRTGPWTDVYALGLTVTEVLTDRPAIDTEDAGERYRITFAERRPTPARTGVDVGPWEPVLARALAMKPQDRQKDARALLHELEDAIAVANATTAGVPLGHDPPKPRKRRFVWVALVAAVVLLAGAGAGLRFLSHGESMQLATAGRPMVIVADFRGAGKESATFADLLSAQLGIGDSMRVPPPDARAPMLDTAGLRSGQAAADSLQRLRAATGADVLVGGAIENANGTLHAEIELFDAARGNRLTALSLSGPAADVNAFVREAGLRVRQALGRPGLSIEDETALRAVLPADPAASLAFVEGLTARRRFHFQEAIDAFERANGLAPSFAPALIALAQAHMSLGHQDAAKAVAERAVGVAPGLPRGDELLVYALAAETRSDWGTAVDNYRTLAQFYPERIDYVTSLGRSLVGAGKAAEAITLLDNAKKRPTSDWDLVRIDLMAAFAHSRRSDDAASMAAAKRAEVLAAKIGARVLEADAILSEAHAHHRAGRLDEATSLFERARAVYADVGDEDNLLNCDSALAGIAGLRGDYPKAIALAESIAAAHRKTGNIYRLAHVTVSLGLFHAAAGELTKARALFDEGGNLCEQAHDREGQAWRFLNLAELDITMGNLEGVAEKIERGRAIHAEIGMRAGVAESDAAVARLAWRTGHFADAEAKFDIALGEAREAGEAGLRAETALDRARLAWERGDADEGARFDEAVKLVGASSDARFAALLDVHAARRALAAGDVVEARRAAEGAEKAARSSHATDAIALALAVSLDVKPEDLDGGTSLRDARRTELATRVEQLEAVEPQVDALLALARAMGGEPGIALADRAVRIASDHGMVASEQVARRSLARLRSGTPGAEVARADAALKKLGALGLVRSRL